MSTVCPDFSTVTLASGHCWIVEFVLYTIAILVTAGIAMAAWTTYMGVCEHPLSVQLPVAGMKYVTLDGGSQHVCSSWWCAVCQV
jgi:hypothetical protein